MVVTNIRDNFKLVAFGYCDEIEHMYKLGKSSSSPSSNKYIAMVVNAKDDNC
jgi:hypothetical protein